MARGAALRRGPLRSTRCCGGTRATLRQRLQFRWHGSRRPGSQIIMRPPVVSEAEMAMALGDGGQIARETACVCPLITKIAQLDSAPPNWRTYLVRSWEQTSRPATLSAAHRAGGPDLQQDTSPRLGRGRAQANESPCTISAGCNAHHRHGALSGAVGAPVSSRTPASRPSSRSVDGGGSELRAGDRIDHHHLATRPAGERTRLAWRAPLPK